MMAGVPKLLQPDLWPATARGYDPLATAWECGVVSGWPITFIFHFHPLNDKSCLTPRNDTLPNPSPWQTKTGPILSQRRMTWYVTNAHLFASDYAQGGALMRRAAVPVAHPVAGQDHGDGRRRRRGRGRARRGGARQQQQQ